MITKNPLWVLNISNSLPIGGAQAFLYNYYKYIDKDKVQFAFAVQGEEVYSYEDELLQLGARIHRLPDMRKHPILYMKFLSRLLKKTS